MIGSINIEKPSNIKNYPIIQVYTLYFVNKPIEVKKNKKNSTLQSLPYNF